MFNGSENERHILFENLQAFSRSEMLAAWVGWKEM